MVYYISRSDIGSLCRRLGAIIGKVRFAAKVKGKSGGVRVITFYSGVEIPVFLLNVFAKNEKIDLSGGERNTLKKILSQLVQVYKGTN